MSRLHVTLACGDYDRVAPLKDGRVRPEGVDLNFVPLGPEEIFFRMARYRDFDAAEMSLASYVLEVARGAAELVAIPVFPSRMFRHSAIYVNADAGIASPADLRARRIGLPEYQMTAMVWVKGILSDDFGVRVQDVHWFTGGLERPGREERVPLKLPSSIDVRRIGPDQTLNDMLARGELDAVLSARAPSALAQNGGRVRRLFERFPDVERDYFQRTGIFPIMHTVVIRRDVHERHQWLAQSLYKAFVEAQAIALTGLSGAPALRYALAWLDDYLDLERRTLGANAWDHGVEPNRRVVETLVRYLVEQGIIEAPVPIERLFAPSTLAGFRI